MDRLLRQFLEIEPPRRLNLGEAVPLSDQGQSLKSFLQNTQVELWEL